MDPNANGNPVNPDNKPIDPENAPINPETGQPDRAAEVSALKAWLRENRTSMVVSVVAIALVIRYLDPIGTLLVVFGLGLVIFIHELGHFLAAKWCDVHVSVFSIGFGPAVPFCSYKYGETTYKVGIIPLGGFVKMVGEGEDAEPEDEDNDPRSFRRKTVGQRMLIISAGVVMNIILGFACFIAAYLHGVQEIPGVVGRVEAGGGAWRSGVRTDDELLQLGSMSNPSFKDIPPLVMSTHKGETLNVEVRRDGKDVKGIAAEPMRDEGQLFPQLGIGSASSLKLISGGKKKLKPAVPGTPAAAAKSADGKEFEPGDTLVAMTDPDKPGTITPLTDSADYYRRAVRLAGQEFTVHVQRKGAEPGAPPVALPVAPAYRHDLGLRMRMGEVVAVRTGGPAEGKVNPRQEGAKPGDRIVEVTVTGADGKPIRFAAGDKANPLDPLLLPRQLDKWAFSSPPPPNFKVEVVVLREVEHTEKRVPLTLEFDTSFRYARETAYLPNSPLPISGLGLAYWVEGVVEEVVPGGAAEAAKFPPNDPKAGKVSVITAVRLKAQDDKGEVKPGNWKDDLKPHQWAPADSLMQLSPPYELDIKVKRGDEELEFTIRAKPDTNFPVEERGIAFDTDTRVRQAEGIGEAMALGWRGTTRMIKTVYMNLYGLVFGRVSVKTMSGPLTIATTTYRLAEEDAWKLLLFLGMISVNLAVVNFLPIPVLDGGHMVFLILEKVLGRPVPERLFAVAMYIGLALILSLFALTLTNDIRREFFGM